MWSNGNWGLGAGVMGELRQESDVWGGIPEEQCWGRDGGGAMAGEQCCGSSISGAAMVVQFRASRAGIAMMGELWQESVGGGAATGRQ